MSLDQYLDQVWLIRENSDGLFLWAVALWVVKSVLLALLAGVWVSSGSPNQEDVSLVFTENSFHRLMLIKQSWEDKPFPFQLPSSDWNDVAPSLQVHAVDLDDVCERMGFIPKQDQRPQILLSLLAELAGRTVQDYWQQMCVWLEINSDYTPLVTWLQEHDISLLVLLM